MMYGVEKVEPPPLSREEFRQFEKRAEARWDQQDDRFDRLEELMRDASLHAHPHYVQWGAFIGTLVTLSGVAVAAVALMGGV